MSTVKTKPNIPKEWEMKKLDDYVEDGTIELSRGNVISKKDIATNPGANPIYSSSVQNGGQFGKYGDYMFDEELITWSVDGGGNFFYRPKHKFSVTNVSGILKADTKKFNYRFLAYLLEWEHRKLHFDYQTKAHPSVIRELYHIVRPPINEQQKIAEILSAVDAEIQKTDEVIAATEKLKRGLMQQLFTRGIGHTKFKKTETGEIPEEWRVVALEQIIEIKHGFAFKGEHFSDSETPHILLTPVNFKIGGGFSSIKFKYYDGPVPKDFVLNGGDLLITMTDLSKAGDTLGYPALVPHIEGKKFLHNQRLGRVIIKSKGLDKPFLYWRLMAKDYRQLILSTATGTTVRHTSPNRIKSFQFAMPSKKEQEEISEILFSIDKKISTNWDLKEKFTVLKKGLMQDLLSGKKRTI